MTHLHRFYHHSRWSLWFWARSLCYGPMPKPDRDPLEPLRSEGLL